MTTSAIASASNLSSTASARSSSSPSSADTASRHTIASSAEYMSLSTSATRRLLDTLNVPHVASYRNSYGKTVRLYAQHELDRVMETDEYTASRARAATRAASAEKTKTALDRYLDEIASRVSVHIRSRSNPLPRAVIYDGPTNSGKTYRALEELSRLFESDPTGVYVYAGPLRLLAYEVYEKMCARYGEESVGFVTGEESIRPDAPIRCCTVECAPRSGTVIVLDETHWLLDEDRGHHWTNILIGGEYDSMLVVSAAEAVPAIRELLGDAESIESVSSARLTGLSYNGKVNISRVPPRTAVVAFSRKAVYALAREINKTGRVRAGVLYGSMPLDCRRRVIDRYINGNYDVIVCTDVIGHGINLPIDNVVMAETEKFDGKMRRELKRWECAQIVGRAGRFGLSDTGTGRVFILSGLPWLSPRGSLVDMSVDTAKGTRRADIEISRVFITPSWEDLGIENPIELMSALNAWTEKAEKTCRTGLLFPSPMPGTRALIEAIAQKSSAGVFPKKTGTDGGWRMSADELWHLATSPLDPASSVLSDIVKWANDPDRGNSNLLVKAVGHIGYLSDNAKEGAGYIQQIIDDKKKKQADWEKKWSDKMDQIIACGTEWKQMLKADERERQIKNIRKRNKRKIEEAAKTGKDPVLEPEPKLLSAPMTQSEFDKRWKDTPRGEKAYKKKQKKLSAEIRSVLQESGDSISEIVDTYETAYKELCQLKTIYNIFGTIGSAKIERVDDLVCQIDNALMRIIDKAIEYNQYGICQSCGGQCAPWFFECDSCHRSRVSRRYRYDDWYGYGGDSWYDDDWF